MSDAPSGVSFLKACNHHDGCYGVPLAPRDVCDAVFYSEMVQACNAQWWNNYFACRSWAVLYYTGVRLLGGFFYNSTSPTTRISTPMRAG